MKNGYKRANTWGWLVAPMALVLPLVAHGDQRGHATGENSKPVSVQLAQATTMSPAKEAFSRGVEFYSSDRYREAQTEFNRALALDPAYEEARQYLEKCNSRLALESVGGDPGAVPTFETYDPDSVGGGDETPALSPDELKRERVRDHLKYAALYLEQHLYAQAVEIYSHVLQLDPDNKEAKEGLHAASLGHSAEAMVDERRVVDQDRDKIQRYVEEAKQLPRGADAKGIKQYIFRVPEIEEEFHEEKEISEIELKLRTSVNIEFEDIHLKDVMEFIQDSFDINVVIDKRAVEPERDETTTTVGLPGQPGFGTQPGAGFGGAGAFPRTGGFGSSGGSRRRAEDDDESGGFGGFGGGGFGGGFGAGGFGQGTSQFNLNSLDEFYGPKSDGMIPYINLKDTPLGQALKALLRPLGLAYKIEPGFLFVSKPIILQRESFEDVDTRYYELRNAGAETLFKIVLANPFSVSPLGGGGGGGFGGGQGGFGGGSQGGFGGSQGGFGGGSGGFGGSSGGFGGGGLGGGGFGGSSGGFGGSSGGFGGGGFGGGGLGGGGFGGGGQGGFGGGGQGGFGGGGQGGFGGGGQGGFGGGQGGGGDVTAVSNISQLFTNISDALVGEIPATQFIVGLDGGGTGTGGLNQGQGGGGIGGGGGRAGLDDEGGAGLGGTGTEQIGGDAPILSLLQRLIPDVYAPSSEERLSDMIYNPANNMLIVTNTPGNLDNFEEQLAQLDVTPKQVSIEAKFLTIRVADMDKVGFQWDISAENNSGARLPTGLEDSTYEYDINGDNVLETIPLDQRPDGSNAFSNTLRETVATALVSPGPQATSFNLMTSILDNGSGDSLAVTFDYLNSLEESELLSAPRVTTMNRKPAVIVDFTTEYFLVSVQTAIVPGTSGINGTTQPIVANTPLALPFNFGISLSVTPQIRDNDQVRLWLNPEVRTRIGEKTFTTSVVSGDIETENLVTYPTTSWQAVWTNVIVHDGDTLVLGGLVQDQSIKGEQKLPYIADLPIIGYFFRGKSKEVTQSSLLIFVTPDIIDSTGARFFDIASAE